VCAAPWSGDLHQDHEAAGRAAAAACLRAGVTRWQYPIWAWHWARPADPRVPWARAATVPLPARARRVKRAAIGEFASQLWPLGPDPADAAILPPEVVAHFVRPLEVVLR